MEKTILSMLLLGIVVLAGCALHPAANNTVVQNETQSYSVAQARILGVNPYTNDTDGDGIPDKADQHPNQVDIPVNPSTGPVGFKIVSAIVENNVDAAGSSAPDHLEITLQSTTDKDLNNMAVFYSITDLSTNKSESYLVKLNGFTLKAHATETIHFDAQKEYNEQFPQNHYAANPNSIYYLSKDSLKFKVMINAEGYEAQNIEITKDAGGAEQPD
jgi:hypothetical protein